MYIFISVFSVFDGNNSFSNSEKKTKLLQICHFVCFDFVREKNKDLMQTLANPIKYAPVKYMSYFRAKSINRE